jgi:hypothetical protein
MPRKTRRLRQRSSKSMNKNRLKYQKRMNNKRIIGGNSYQVINLTTSAPLNTQLDAIMAKEYDLVYVSIGGKLNETSFVWQGETIESNSSQQIVPFFLTNKDTTTKILCISIDQFQENADISKADNDDIKKTYRNIQYITPNIDLFFIDTTHWRDEILRTNGYDAESQAAFVGELIGIISEKMRSKSLDPKNYMVCNYVKFKNPIAEVKLKNLLIDKIYSALESYGYQDCYYNWCGYGNIIFYNYIMKGKNDIIPPTLDVESQIFNVLLRKDKEKLEKSFNHHLTNLIPIVYPNEVFSYSEKDPNVPYSSNNFVYNLKELKDHIYK